MSIIKKDEVQKQRVKEVGVSVHTALKHLRLDKQSNKGSLTIQDLVWYSEDFSFDQILRFIPEGIRFGSISLYTRYGHSIKKAESKNDSAF